MTQEEKELLKDICARLDSGVKVWYKYFQPTTFVPFATSIRLAEEKIALSRFLHKEGDWFPIEEAGEILIKPYLRPLSSMTVEEAEEYNDLVNELSEYDCQPEQSAIKIIDWLNKKMFDYRGLIPMGLALEAPENMYTK